MMTRPGDGVRIVSKPHAANSDSNPGQGVFLAWETLACDALRSGRLVAPFPDRYPTGFSYWYVMGKYAARSRAVRDFEAWLRSALEASIEVE
jgi:LysR family transcriptional regulator, glycine cleavage system transcriptional activator